MKRHIEVTAMLFIILMTGPALAASPQAIHYHGYLTDADGTPLTDTVEMEFRLYDVEVAGEAFWSTPEAIAVDVENGVFRVNLAPVTAEQLAAGEVWLGITVIPADPGEPAQEMEPRLKVLSVPYALVAEHAATADVAGEAAAVTNVDFSTFATGDDVQGVLGLCIQEAELTEVLSGYCAGPCYGDAEVELFITENGYVTFDALAQWAEENISVGLDEDALAAYLSANGYMTEADLLWFLGEAGYPAADDVVLRDGSKSLQGDWDVGGNQLLNLVMHNAASENPPEEPNAGQLWWDTTEKLVKVYDGEVWKTVGGGDVAFASDCDTIDGLDSSAFEPAGAVAAHEAAYGHLGGEQLATLTGGGESNADALHTHDVKGGLPNVNPDLLTSVFTKKYCSTDTPVDAGGDIGQIMSSIEIGDTGNVISASIEAEVTYASADSLVLSVVGPGGTVEISDLFQLDVSGDWEFDVSSLMKGAETSGSWVLKVKDLEEDQAVATLKDWCITVKYMSSSTLKVNGDVETESGSVATNTEALLTSLLGLVLAGVDASHLDNVLAEWFDSDSATSLAFMKHDGAEGGYKVVDSGGQRYSQYIVIEADSVGERSVFAKYGCALWKIKQGRWVVVSHEEDPAQQRAGLMAMLCKEGEDSVLADAIVGVTSLQTTFADDVGKRCHWLSYKELGHTNPGDEVLTNSGADSGSFGDTVDNLNCTMWVKTYYASVGYGLQVLPTGGVGGTNVNDFGKAPASWTGDNPTGWKIKLQGGINYNVGTEAIILAAGGMVDVTQGADISLHWDSFEDGGLPPFSEVTPDNLLAMEKLELAPFLETASYGKELSLERGILKGVLEAEMGDVIEVFLSAAVGQPWQELAMGKVFELDPNGVEVRFRFHVQRDDVSHESAVRAFALHWL